MDKDCCSQSESFMTSKHHDAFKVVLAHCDSCPELLTTRSYASREHFSLDKIDFIRISVTLMCLYFCSVVLLFFLYPFYQACLCFFGFSYLFFSQLFGHLLLVLVSQCLALSLRTVSVEFACTHKIMFLH